MLTRLMSDFMEIEEVMITRCEYYSDLGERRKKPIITQKIQGDLEGKRVLLLDDVADTGESLKVISSYLRSKKPRKLTIATIYVKPWTIITPDFYAASTDAWIIFPWETYEAIKLLKRKNGLKILEETKIPKSVIQRLQKFDGSLLD